MAYERQKIEQALVGRGYVADHKASTATHICYRKPSGVPKSRAVVFMKRDGSEVQCGETLLTAEPSPQFLKVLAGDFFA